MHVGMLRVCQVFFHTKHKWLSCNSEILNMIIFEFELAFLFLFHIDQVLIDEHLIDGQVGYLLLCVLSGSSRLHFIGSRCWIDTVLSCHLLLDYRFYHFFGDIVFLLF